MFCILVATQRNGVGWRLLKIPTPTYPYPEQRQYKPSGLELWSGEALMDRKKGPLLDRLWETVLKAAAATSSRETYFEQ